MITPGQRSARAALDAARPAVARLDSTRGGEDLAADLIEIWRAVEGGLRSLVGSSVLGGQALIREARQRQLIGFAEANSLAEFEAVHTRVQDIAYRPTESDVNAARNAYLKFDAALMTDTVAAPVSGVVQTPSPVIAPQPGAPVSEPAIVVPAARSGTPRWLIPALAALVLVLAVGGYLIFGSRGSSSMSEGVAAYKAGQREVAVSAFNKAARENPKDPMPHIYLGRMAREVGNFSLAANELQLALQADPNNAIALREMGANLLQQGNNELARRFYVRAVQADPSDKMSQGYLGCALLRLGRYQEGSNFLNRAGPGPWTSCVAASAQGAAPVPPGTSIPR